MPKDTKTALLDCAEHAARTRGIDGFSYADLSKNVGIRKASIHYHFSTKAALSAALMQRYHRALAQTCADIEADNSTGGTRLEALIEIYRRAAQDGKSLCLCVSFSASRNSLPDDVISEIRLFRRMMTDWLEQAFALGQADGTISSVTSPKAEAAAALSLLEGAQLAARAEEDIALFETALQLLKSRV